MNRFQKWALATTIATYMLIFVGGMVRASDAGLGCPDWPKCFDRYYPPLTAEQLPDHIDPETFDFQLAWIEYTNRMIGVIIGLLIMGTLYLAWRHHRETRRVLYPTLGAFVLTLFQGWLGGQVVESELNPLHITAHLVVAWMIVNLLMYATVNAFFPDSSPFVGMSQQRRTLGRITLVLLALTLLQAGLGANLRGELEVVEQDNPLLERADWIAEVGAIDMIHRSFSWLIIAATALLVYYVRRRLQGNTRWLSLTAYSIVVLIVLQIAAGIGLAYAGLPPVLQPIHLIVGSLLIGDIMLMYLLAGRVPETLTRPATAEPRQPTLLTGQTA